MKNAGQFVFAIRILINIVCLLGIQVEICSQVKPKLTFSLAHNGGIRSLCFSMDEKYILTSAGDGTAKLWETSSGKLLRTFAGHQLEVAGAIFSPDGMQVLTTSLDNTTRIWDARTGEMVFSLYHENDEYTTQPIKAVYSPDGKYILSCNENFSHLWDGKTGEKLFTLDSLPYYINIYAISFSSDGKFCFTSTNGQYKIWETRTGKQNKIIKSTRSDRDYITAISPDASTVVAFHFEDGSLNVKSTSGYSQLFALKNHTFNPGSVTFSQDGRYFLAISTDSTVSVWKAKTGELIYQFSNPAGQIQCAAFSTTGDEIAFIGMENTVEIHELLSANEQNTRNDSLNGFQPREKDGRRKISLGVNQNQLVNVRKLNSPHLINRIISSDPGGIELIIEETLTIVEDTIIVIHDSTTGKITDSLLGHSNTISSAFYTKDRKYLISTAWDHSVIIWDLTTKAIHRKYRYPEPVLGALAYPNHPDLVLWRSDGTVAFMNYISGYEHASFQFHNWVDCVEISPDGKTVAVCNDEEVYVFDTDRPELPDTLHLHTRHVNSVKFSPDNTKIITASGDSTVAVWDTNLKERILTLKEFDSWVYIAEFNDTGDRILTVSGDMTMKIWSFPSGELLRSINLGADIISASFDPVHGYLIAILNSGIRFFNSNTYAELITFSLLNDSNWVVYSSLGLFDASPGAMEQLYYVQEMEVIEFEQIKNRYYEPGLWDKVMSGANLRDVRSLNTPLPLYPEVSLAPVDQSGDLAITLTKRNGGYGDVQILINGKEVSGNIRGREADTALNKLTCRFHLSNHPYLIPDQENTIKVIAYERDNWLHSRGKTVMYQAPRSTSSSKPGLFGVCIGISDYTGDDIDLKYAAKDAQDMTSALALGGRKLFGTDQTTFYSLVSPSCFDSTQPTKSNISSVFRIIAEKAKSEDVLVVYLAGHGFSQSGAEGDYYFLTKEAHTADPQAYTDPFLRKSSALSSAELTELIKSIPALKQVLIIDACESGKVVESLSHKRMGLNSNAIRALDRMKDRTGMHVLTGSASDAVSYEADRYGQGVLTYSLLEGMRGAALRDSKFIDVINLFQYSRNRVPELAKRIGCVQEPQLISPYGSSSFDIGLLDDQDRMYIPLAAIKPVFVRSSFFETTKLFDVMGLSKTVDEMLSHNASRGDTAPYIFADIHEYPDSYAISGGYRITGEGMEVNGILRRGSGIQVTFSFKAKTKEELLQKLFAEIGQITGDHE